MTKSYRAHPITEVFPTMSEDEFQTLKGDIEENGQLEPIWLDTKGRIIDGRHRLRACRQLKIEPEFQETTYLDEEIPAIVIALNLRRRHLSESQKANVAAKMVPYFEKAAAARQKAGVKAEGEDLGANLPQGKDEAPGKSSDKAGRVIGVSGRSVRDALKVQADGCDELKEALETDQVAVSDAATAAKETKTVQKQVLRMVASGKAKNLKAALKEIRKQAAIKEIEAMDPAKGGYPVIVADPAWPYETRKDDATQRGQTPYNQMTIQQICDYNVPNAEDGILFLWTTNSHLANGNAARVCTAWGYQPKTIYTWRKNKWGTGDWGRSQTEHVVVGVRGKPKLKEVPSTIFDGDVREHSEKPEEFYKLIERITAGAKAELFARQKREGWFCHGHEIKGPKLLIKKGADAGEEPEGKPHVWGKADTNDVAVCEDCSCEAKRLGKLTVRAGKFKGREWEFCPGKPTKVKNKPKRTPAKIKVKPKGS